MQEGQRFTNALIHETSLYLLQHAHNPVDWQPWSQTALDRAKAEDKPILLSIGYASCHWCHVMEKESFEDEKTAQLMNDHFINIKVDREERPDLDHIYMQAVQLMSGSGGWPLNVFLTPEGRPFFGGTYFPPEPKYRKPSWEQVLNSVLHWWTKERDQVFQQANALTTHLSSNVLEVRNDNTTIDSSFTFFEQLKDHYLAMADREFGGFGKAPKFPQFSIIEYLLAYASLYEDKLALDHAIFSLHAMIKGGIYDQLEGGISRYSTDEKWLVPHFEKMLYDNALLIQALSRAYSCTRDPWLKDRLAHVFDFCLSNWQEGGCLFSSIDADSEGREGLFYTWTFEELVEHCGEDAPMVTDYFGVLKGGNWEEGLNVLHINTDHESLAARYNLSISDVEARINNAIRTLRDVRSQRKKPVTDKKQIFSWNAMFINAVATAFESTGDNRYREVSVRLFEQMMLNFSNEGQLSHHESAGVKSDHAFLEDYAYGIQAALQLYRITAETYYIDQASKMMKTALDDYFDWQSGLFSYSGLTSDTPIKKADLHDSSYPSSNGLMHKNLVELGLMNNNAEWLTIADRMRDLLLPQARSYPAAYSNWALGWLKTDLSNRSVLTLPSDKKEEIMKFLRLHYLPGTIIVYKIQSEIELCFHDRCFRVNEDFTEIKKLLKK